MRTIGLLLAAALIGAATPSSSGFAGIRHQPKTAAEYLDQNWSPNPLFGDPGVVRRKANYR
jgi:hypothetical protein